MLTRDGESELMVNNDWMDGVLGDQDDASSRFEPTTIKTIVDEIRSREGLSEADVRALVNEALANEAMELRYAKMMAEVESDALRTHVDSPNVARPDLNSRYQVDPAELVAQADEIDAKARLLFEDGRSRLLDTMVALRTEGEIDVDVQSWDELDSLDDDGSINEALDEFGGIIEIKRGAPIAGVRSIPTVADLTKDVGEESLSLDRELRHEKNSPNRQSYVEVEASVGVAEAEAERAAELRGEQSKEGPDDDVAATIARHREQARKRSSSSPKPIGGLAADFMRMHGRDAEGNPLPKDGPGVSPEL